MKKINFTRFFKKYKLQLFWCVVLLILVCLAFFMVSNMCKKQSESFGNYSSAKCTLDFDEIKEDQLFHHVSNMDIVYMWVDGSDEKWLKRNNKKNPNSRNRSNDEILYSIRSICKFMPWHKGKIFIVSPNQKHPKLNYELDNLFMINQDDLLPDEVDTTTNSFLIEIYLCRIPNLSEYFIYMNDDYFFGKPLQPSDFFGLNKNNELVEKFYANNHILRGGRKQSDDLFNKKRKLWFAATLNTNGILNETYKEEPRNFMEHAPYMFKKSHCEDIIKKWLPDFQSMNDHKSRHWKDIIFVLLYRYWCVYENKPCEIVKNTDEIYLKLITNNDEENVKFYKKVCDECPKFFTLNDEYSKDEIKIEMKDFMEGFFKDKSKYEK